MQDLIDRQAAIDALDKRFDNIPMEQTAEILKLRKDLRELPTIQPKERTEKRTETHACDLISRQQAIDTICAVNDAYKSNPHIDAIIDALEDLPSVQPEPKEGEWVQVRRFEGDVQPELECPFCKHKVGWWDMARYCAGCGAKLEGGAG